MIGKPGAPDITIQVVDIKGDKVRIGVTAAPNVEVNREEIADRIVREGQRRVGQ